MLWSLNQCKSPIYLFSFTTQHDHTSKFRNSSFRKHKMYHIISPLSISIISIPKAEFSIPLLEFKTFILNSKLYSSTFFYKHNYIFIDITHTSVSLLLLQLYSSYYINSKTEFQFYSIEINDKDKNSNIGCSPQTLGHPFLYGSTFNTYKTCLFVLAYERLSYSRLFNSDPSSRLLRSSLRN